MTDSNRGSFGSKIGLILATAGGAVGLGNVWRFPYMAGQEGGGKLIVPQGVWFTGPITLKSNINLHIEKGGIILATAQNSWVGTLQMPSMYGDF